MTPRVRALGGLANRLRVLFSYRAKARNDGFASIECVWVPDGEIANARFEDVFEPIPGVRWLDDARGDENGTTDPTHAAGPAWGSAYRDLALRSAHRSQFDLLRSLRGRTTAMHVRRSDLPLTQRLPQDSFDAFAEWAKRAPAPVFLATCSGEAQREMRARLGDRVYWQRDIPEHEHQDVSGQRNTTLAEAAIDLFMCAGAPQGTFRGSACSSFSHLVARLQAIRGWWS